MVGLGTLEFLPYEIVVAFGGVIVEANDIKYSLTRRDGENNSIFFFFSPISVGSILNCSLVVKGRSRTFLSTFFLLFFFFFTLSPCIELFLH